MPISAICVSEAETAFPDFLEKFESGQDYTTCKSFWFRRSKSDHQERICAAFRFRRILDALFLSRYPGDNEVIYQAGSESFVPLSHQHYLDYDALSYNTVWSRGCPYKCTYCGNTRFFEIDREFGKLRHASVEHLIAEIRRIDEFPLTITSIAFHDDCFIGLPPETLQEFSDKMKSGGSDLSSPITSVTQGDKVHAKEQDRDPAERRPFNRVRMGVQSGSGQKDPEIAAERPNRAGFIRPGDRHAWASWPTA